jgi:hypothetical protein
VSDNLDDLDLERFFAAHREPSDTPDVMQTLRTRTAPKHRARRRQWKPPLEPVQAQHLQDSDALVR